MANGLAIKTYLDIALTGTNHYARQGIASLLALIDPTINIKISVSDCQRLDTASGEKIDILFLSATERYTTSLDCLELITKIKNNHPELVICMYSTHANSLLWVRGDIDAYVSLQEPIYYWRASLLKMVDSRYRPKKKPLALSLTPSEWRVLKELKKGLNIKYIAEIEHLSYRRVSALKNSATRKLGLRNKTDLLVFLTS
ncbi:helix-turn-helix domain-containing protein [Cedecea colo]|uniref:Helix-turn-helix transcriptional regulator n=1 Tax=Cedecea colo TaxID=2552946 RepID=A0ABX0VNP1_9ENTR|nr:LuxR C-terminal-related transcriptional regulator [Cedecea colo]NIY47846.1 helix-turn-helix transcriptional regulator [Cedecea colo]